MKRLRLTELEEYVRSIDAAAYAKQRNYLGGSTRISEYVSRGAISLPRVRDLLLINNTPGSAYKLLNELAWREYWQLVWQVKGTEIFTNLRSPRPKGTIRSGLPVAVLQARTGIKTLDDGIIQLQQTGYIDNHMRMWLAGLICNVAKCDWRAGADWMHSYLIDGDYASNHLSWQWVAGTYTGKPYLPQQDNINKYSKSSQHGTYLDHDYDVIAAMDVPDTLTQTSQTLPSHPMQLPTNTISVEQLSESDKILLYSPWTLDPLWRAESTGTKVLLIDTVMFHEGTFSQNVIDSIVWFANQIPDLHIICSAPKAIGSLPKRITIIRKSYAGINDWPGQADPPELLHPEVPQRFYPSFSAFWKQTKPA